MRARFLALLLLAACGTETVPETPTPGPAKLDIPANAPLVIFLGDSISAGLHLPEDEAFPAVIQRDLFERGVAFRLINAGHSGDTTAGGLRRAPFILERKPAILSHARASRSALPNPLIAPRVLVSVTAMRMRFSMSG